MLKKTGPLCIFPPKMSSYRTDFDETKYISFLIKNEEILENYNEIWKKLKIVSTKNLIVNLYTVKDI